jgi:hypothetical protein
LRGADFDAGSAVAAGRFDRRVGTKHSSDAERIDGTKGIQLASVKLNAMLCCLFSERAGVINRAGCVIHSKKIMRLQFGHERPDLFRREVDRFANLRQANSSSTVRQAKSCGAG